MSLAQLLFCLRFGLDCAFAVESPQSFERDSVPLAPQVSDTEPDQAPAAPNGALELNPLAVGLGKFGGNIEISLAPHHALILSPAYFSANDFRGPEGELGYRYYFYPRSLSGPFVGAGILGAALQYRREPGAGCGTNAESCAGNYESTLIYGATVEAGWQWIIADWLLLGVGAGVEAQHASARKFELYQGDFTSVTELVVDSGIRPRVLGTVGVTF